MADESQTTHSDSNPGSTLFDDFEPPTLEDWRSATIASLKGRPIEKLTTHTVEGIDVMPLYRHADIADLVDGVAELARSKGASVRYVLGQSALNEHAAGALLRYVV